MKITITNFRTYDKQVTFEFKDNKITLLSGRSGIGKSTIFQAINWCLYSGMTHITPKNIEKCKTTVKIELGNLTIERSKPPNTLKVINETCNLHCVDSDAQSYINSYFGSKELWTTCSYILQDEKSLILSLTNVKKFELLQELTFGDSNDSSSKTPEYFYKIIDDILPKIKENILEDTNKYNGYCEALETLEESTKECNENWNSMGNLKYRNKEIKGKYVNEIIDDFEDIEDLIEQLNVKYSETLIKENEHQNSKSKIQEIEPIIEQLKLKIKNISYDEILLLEKIKTLQTEKNKLHINENHLTLGNVNDYKQKLIDEKNLYEQYSIGTIDEFEELKNLYINTEIWKKRQYEIFNEMKSDFIISNEEKEKLNEKNKYINLQEDKKKLKQLNYAYFMQLKHDYLKCKLEEQKLKENENLNVYLMCIEFEKRKSNSELKQKYISDLSEYQLMKKWEKWEIVEELYNDYEKELKIYIDNENKKKENTKLTYYYEKDLKSYNDYQDYISTKNEIENKMQKYNLQTIESLDNEIANLKLNLKEIFCPCCQNGLIFKNGILVKGNSNLSQNEQIKDRLEELEQIKNEYRTLKNVAECEKPEKPILNEILDLEEPEKPEFERIKKPDKRPKNSDLVKPKEPTLEKENLNISLETFDSIKFNLNNIEQPTITEFHKIDKNFLNTKFEFTLNEIEQNCKAYEEECNSNFQGLSIVQLKQNIDKTQKQINLIGSVFDVDVDLTKIKEFPYSLDEIETNLKKYKNHDKRVVDDGREIANKKELKVLNQFNLNVNVTKNKSEIMKELLSLYNLEKFVSISNELESCSKKCKSCDELEMSSKEFEQIEEKIKFYEKELINLNKTINAISVEISSKELKIQIDELTLKSKKLKKLFEDGKKVLQLKKHKDKLNAKSENLKHLIKKETVIQNIKKIVTEESTKTMNDMLDNINAHCNLFLEYLFEEQEVEISLKTHKLLKTGDNKLCVNLDLNYNGNYFDNLNEISGGEQRRISFALTLAIAKVVGTPFILFDECMASLDGELREKCVKLLKRFFSETTIINICHEIIEGLHDDTLYLNG